MSGPKTHSWIEALDVYVTGKAKVSNDHAPIKLSANESALGPSPMAMEAYRNGAKNLHRYPDPAYHDLRDTLAAKYKIEKSQIVCGVGSDEILKLACRAYITPGDEAIFVAHSFSMYPIAVTSVGGVPVEVEDENFTANVDNILAAVTEKTKIIFIANPNNPTGTYISSDDIDRLWQNIPDHVLLVLDAAYAEFIDEADYDTGIKMVAKSKNVLMTRTFSKLYGLAALRLGWSYACKEIAETLDKIRDPFNVPSSAQLAGVAALKDTEFEKAAFNHTKKWREWLSIELKTLGLKVIPSYTNFILFEFTHPEKTALMANEYLLSHGYILRYYSAQGLHNFLRLTIGTEEENKDVILLLKEFLEK
ncbi:MAG: histidinol-phosphate transaminase [Emcibacteraceae bacterium]|nr:histidinol-phosphate transaminase [Emcibacteraceae bacterium]MDG1995283.1 histidinol-phosphate transaminase [Emcibacteraceae bacterium]